MNNIEFLNVKNKHMITSQDSYEKVMEKLKDARLDCLPVIDEKNFYSGLLHRYDLVEKWQNSKKVTKGTSNSISDFINDKAQVDIVSTSESNWLSSLIKKSSHYKHSMVPIINKDGTFKCFAYSPSNREVSRIVSAFKPSITIIGMGYVGVTLAVIMAKSGLKVTCIEKDQVKRKILKSGKVPFHETGLNEIYAKLYREKKLIIKGPEDKNKSNFIVISVGTPLQSESEPNIDYLNQSIDLANKQLKDGGIIVLRSTIPFGTTLKIKQQKFDELISPDAEKAKHVVFCPERTIEGNALEELYSNPQIIGSESSIARGKVRKVFEQFVSQTIELAGVSEAELVKLCDNTYRDLSFAFSNTLASISMNYDVDIISVIDAANKDYPRTNIFYPSPGVGGPCLSKDPFILSNGLSGLSKDISNYLHSGRNVSQITINYISKKIILLKKNQNTNIVLCGLAFKGDPITDDLRNSTSLELLSRIEEKVEDLKVWDPVISKKDLKDFGINNIWFPPPWNSEPKKELIIILANNSPYFSQLNWNSIVETSLKLTIVDCWGVCENLMQLRKPNVDYFRLGRNL